MSLSKQTQPEVDKDEILAELGEGTEEVARRTLRSMRHVVVGVVLEGYTAKEERDDTCEVGLRHSGKGEERKQRRTNRSS